MNSGCGINVLASILVTESTCNLDPLPFMVVSYVPGEFSMKLCVAGLRFQLFQETNAIHTTDSSGFS